jgi:hypothetical protein
LVQLMPMMKHNVPWHVHPFESCRSFVSERTGDDVAFESGLQTLLANGRYEGGHGARLATLTSKAERACVDGHSEREKHVYVSCSPKGNSSSVVGIISMKAAARRDPRCFILSKSMISNTSLFAPRPSAGDRKI